jgi:sec-independent protein translocase protein TatC
MVEESSDESPPSDNEESDGTTDDSSSVPASDSLPETSGEREKNGATAADEPSGSSGDDTQPPVEAGVDTPSTSEPDTDTNSAESGAADSNTDDHGHEYGQNLTDADIAELQSDWNPADGAQYETSSSGDVTQAGGTGTHEADGADDADEPGAAYSPADGPPPSDTPEPGHHSPGGEAKSDGGYAGGAGTGTVDSEYDAPTPVDEEFPPDGPASDQEMPLADHIEEMVRRLGVVIVVMAAVSGVVFPFGAEIINLLWYSILDAGLVSGEVPSPRAYAPLALILARLKVATLAGFVVGLPVFVYQTYLFMRPGLYPKERRYYLASVPTSLVLATVGVFFAYLLVLPFLFTYFLGYTEAAANIAFGLTETFDLMVLMLGWFALIFQIPLFVSLALMMGVVSRQWMAARRLYFWGAFVGIAFLFAPDPTGMAPILVAATMITLFEGTLFLDKWTKRGRQALLG